MLKEEMKVNNKLVKKEMAGEDINDEDMEMPKAPAGDEFGFDDAEDDMYYDIDGSGGGLLDVEPDLEDFLFG